MENPGAELEKITTSNYLFILNKLIGIVMIADNRNSPITTKRRFLRKKTWKRVCPVTKRLVLTRSVSSKCTVQYSVYGILQLYGSTVLAVEQVKISNTR